MAVALFSRWAASFRMESARVVLVAQKDPLMWQSIFSVTGNKVVLGAGALPVFVEGVVVGALAAAELLRQRSAGFRSTAVSFAAHFRERGPIHARVRHRK